MVFKIHCSHAEQVTMTNYDGPVEAAIAPEYPQLASASLFPPPPPSHVLFTPLNQHFYAVLKQHWPEEGSAQSRALTDADNQDDQQLQSSSSQLGWNKRLLLQRSILLQHSSKLDQIPEAVKELTSALETDQDVVDAVHAIGAVDLQLEMDPPDLSIITEQAKGYHLFGQWWPIPAVVTGIEEAGIKRLYQEDAGEDGSIDRRPALQLLLRSLITSYLKLLSLLQFPPSYYALSTVHQIIDPNNPQTSPDPNTGTTEEVTWLTTSSSEWNHLRNVALNIQEVLNRSRKDQAKQNLQTLMRLQIQHKRNEVQRLREVMKGVRETISQLKTDRDDDNGNKEGMQVDA
ncbi:unnamed protein product [Sympodiomycopsis kandeliae]